MRNLCESENRGLSTVAGYTLTLAVTGILITGIIAGTAGFVESESELTAANQLEIAGNTLESEIGIVRGIATDPANSNTQISTTVDLPDRTTTGQYLINVTDNQIQLETVDSDVTVTEPLPDANDKVNITSNGRIAGGDVEICYSGDDIVVDTTCSGVSDTDSNTVLEPAKDSGELVRTSGTDILEFRIKNIGSDQATVEQFAVDATDIDASMEIDDGNAEEFDIQRTNSQSGYAGRDDPGSFDATGTQYDMVADSTDSDAQYAKITSGTDDAEVDIRRFSQNIPTLEWTDSASEADITVTLVLEDGNEEYFHFKEP